MGAAPVANDGGGVVHSLEGAGQLLDRASGGTPPVRRFQVDRTHVARAIVLRGCALERDDFSSNRHLALSYALSMIPPVKPEGMLFRKPVSTPDHVRGRLFRDHALAWCGLLDPPHDGIDTAKSAQVRMREQPQLALERWSAARHRDASEPSIPVGDDTRKQ